MSTNDEASRRYFQSLTKKLVISKWMTAIVCDAAERQYSLLARQENELLKKYDAKSKRLDEFYHTLVSGKDEFHELWQIIQLVLVLSHGQASVERNFSVNEDMLLPNMKAQTLYAMKFVYDAMRSLNVKAHDFVISDRMLQFCR